MLLAISIACLGQMHTPLRGDSVRPTLTRTPPACDIGSAGERRECRATTQHSDELTLFADTQQLPPWSIGMALTRLVLPYASYAALIRNTTCAAHLLKAHLLGFPRGVRSFNGASLALCVSSNSLCPIAVPQHPVLWVRGWLPARGVLSSNLSSLALWVTSNSLCPIAVPQHPVLWMILGWVPAFIPQLPAPDRKTMTRVARPPRTHELTMLLTSGDILVPIFVAGFARLLENAQDIYWVGCGAGMFQIGALSISAARRTYTTAESDPSAVAPRGDPFMREVSGLIVFDIAVSTASVFFGASLSWVHPFAQQIYWIGSGSGMVFVAISATAAAPAMMQAVAPITSKKDRSQELLDESEERLEEVTAELDRSQELLDESEASYRELQGMLASERADAVLKKAELGSVSKEAAFNKAQFDKAFQALKDIVAPPIAADESISEVYNKLMINTQQKVDQLTLMEAEFIAKLEEDRKE